MPYMAQQQRGLKVLDAFPELQQLGAARLQNLSTDWVRTPKAREFAVTSVTVEDRPEGMWLNFVVEFTHDVKEGETYHFPMDDLLFFFAERGIESGVVQQKVKANIIAKRKHVGHSVFQHFETKFGPAFPLFIKCKNPACGNIMRTQWTAAKNQKIRWKDASGTCTRCGTTFSLQDDDFFFMEDEHGGASDGTIRTP